MTDTPAIVAHDDGATAVTTSDTGNRVLTGARCNLP